MRDAFRDLRPDDAGYTWDFSANNLIDSSVKFFARDCAILAWDPADSGGKLAPIRVVDCAVVPVGDTPATRACLRFAVGGVFDFSEFGK